MTKYQLVDGLRVMWKFVIRLLALIGFFAVIAMSSYTYHRDVKVVRSDRCINSACEPGQKCSVRFQKHLGECK